MAAPMRSACRRFQHNIKHVLGKCSLAQNHEITSVNKTLSRSLFSRHNCDYSSRYFKLSRSKLCLLGIGGISSAFLFSAVGVKVACQEHSLRPPIKPSRSVKVATDSTGLKFTLYQFQSCPFCCKVRATLDYYGLSYDIIEVNSVLKTEIKWSKYKKVPILAVEGPNGEVHLRDSSLIISILESYSVDKTQTFEKLLSFYPEIDSTDSRGKPKKDYGNKYFIMYQDQKTDPETNKNRSEERKWRSWVDSDFVHVISPNAYRTPSEAIQAFNHFSDVGEWEKNFSLLMRKFVIYTGATVMYFISKLLKKRYNLKDDVRLSLYDSCNEWMKAVTEKGKFLGGDSPTLADLSVYGVLSSIEGCDCFNDLLVNTKIGPWYKRTKKAVKSHDGFKMFH